MRLAPLNAQPVPLCSMRTYVKGSTVDGELAAISAEVAVALAAIRAIGSPTESFSQLARLAESLSQHSANVADARDWLAAAIYDSGQVGSLAELAGLLHISKTRADQRVKAGRRKGNPVKDPGTDPEPRVVAVAVIIVPWLGVLTEHRTDLAPEVTFAGGEIEEGESPAEALQRRVPVEIGLAIETDYLIAGGVSDRTGRFLRYMKCRLTQPERATDATAELDPDADAVEWMRLDELDKAMPDMNPEVRAVIARELGNS
jgi:8-oxo-dGTP pyrophosphatase MutT (NUDIX family)